MTTSSSSSSFICHLLLALALCHLVSGTGTGNGTKCEEETRSLKECLTHASPILAEATGMGIPSSPEAVNISCRAFDSGMLCFDTFAKACRKPSYRRIIEDQASGARNMFKFLCDDPVFRAKYLKHIPCLKLISREWDTCANRFVDLVKEEMGRANATDHSRQVELCCSKFGFVRCVYSAALQKCRKEDAAFTEQVADTLSNNRAHAPLCRHFETRLCTSRGMRVISLPALALVLLCLAFAW